MKKVLAIGLVVLMLAIPVLATDLDDFRKEQGQLQKRLVEYQQVIANLQVRLVELNALIQYIKQKEQEQQVDKITNEVLEKKKK